MPMSDQPASDQPASDQPASDRLASDQGASDRPASDRFAIDRATLEAFSSTVVRLSDRDCWWQVTPAADGVGKSWLNDEPVHVISAVYSHDVIGALGAGSGDLIATDANFVLRRHLDLAARLEHAASRVGPAVGFAPDLSYGEQCFAVWGLERAAAVAIGLEFHQLAIFEIDADGVRVVGCADGAVLNDSRYHLSYVDTRPCAMGDLHTPEHRVACAPPKPTDDPNGQRELAEWMTTWQQRYGLLGCDVCKGNMGEPTC
jgi:hypothetical protein